MDASPPPDFQPGDDPHDWSREAASCELISPLLQFIEWFNQQPERVQQSVAGEVGRYLADDAIYHALGDMADPVERLLAFYCYAPDDPRQMLRRMFIIRGAMDLMAFQQRGTAADWALHRDWTERRLDQAREQGDEAIVAILDEDPEAPLARARMWMESAASWTRWRNSVLGDEALLCWYEIATWQEG